MKPAMVLTASLLALAACAPSSTLQTSTAGSPRGTIVFGRMNANGDEYVYTIRADGTGEKQLVATLSCCAVWSHKGDRLLLAASPAGGSSSSVTTAIVNADGSGYRVLPLDPSGLNRGRRRQPAAAYDNKRCSAQLLAGWVEDPVLQRPGEQ